MARDHNRGYVALYHLPHGAFSQFLCLLRQAIKSPPPFAGEETPWPLKDFDDFGCPAYIHDKDFKMVMLLANKKLGVS
jgi:hypothetical protein